MGLNDDLDEDDEEDRVTFRHLLTDADFNIHMTKLNTRININEYNDILTPQQIIDFINYYNNPLRSISEAYVLNKKKSTLKDVPLHVLRKLQDYQQFIKLDDLVMQRYGKYRFYF